MKKRIFYGWIIVGAGIAVMATAVGIVNNCFGLFIVPACQELNLTRQDMGITQTMLALGNMVVALFSGLIFKEKRMKPLMCVGGVVMCAAYALFALAHALWQFYLIAIIVSVAQALVNVVPFALIIGNWFHEKRGLAIGMTFMGSGVGGMLFNVIGGRLLGAVGWRGTALVYAAVLAVVVLPCVFFIIRIRPEDMGLLPLGERARTEAEEATGLTLREALRTPRFYMVAIDIAVAGMAVNAIATTSTPYYTDLFASETVGANLASAFMAVLAIGKLSLGGLYDKLGCRRATLLARVLLIVSLLSLAGGRGTHCIALYLLSCGLACASSSVSIPILARSCFGTAAGAAITGIFSALQSFGGLFAPMCCGRVCDLMGSYAPSYRMLAAAVAAMLAPVFFVLSERRGAQKRISTIE